MKKEANKTNLEKMKETLDTNYTGLLQTNNIQPTLCLGNFHFQNNEENHDELCNVILDAFAHEVLLAKYINKQTNK